MLFGACIKLIDPPNPRRKPMFTLIKTIHKKQLLTEQLPLLLVSLLIAELFYKFHSFTLECLSFLATWYILDAIISFFLPRKRPVSSASAAKEKL
jgi:hypothetical protein